MLACVIVRRLTVNFDPATLDLHLVLVQQVLQLPLQIREVFGPTRIVATGGELQIPVGTRLGGNEMRKKAGDGDVVGGHILLDQEIPGGLVGNWSRSGSSSESDAKADFQRNGDPGASDFVRREK
jgi:hypothetical protein